jgi:hypothetical protein
MSELRLNRLTNRILAVETFFNDLLHHGNIPDVPEKASNVEII